MTDSDPSDTFQIFGQTISQCQTCGQAMVGTKPTCKECADKPQLDWTCQNCGLGITGWSTDPETEIMCPGCNQRLEP
ncbi:Zn ribbon [Haloarcula tailed virus 3]|uniref:Zn ribbon n=1 Tax=Haloarcula tailed virus 3 TaxID=2877990 RepID=A0AAE8Y1T6_9CAUD|nr:Zn ribbon [Haloarcula tailed virus 3]UBF23353.1 Zn ribbon [Haloarcula tailed virus 3]